MGAGVDLDESAGVGIIGGEMNTERDRFLTEAMGGVWLPTTNMGMVKGPTCKESTTTKFSTWAGFGKLWEWAQEQEWFDLFQCCLYYHEYLKHCHKPGDEKLDNDKVLHNELIHPDRFAAAVYEFLRERA